MGIECPLVIGEHQAFAARYFSDFMNGKPSARPYDATPYASLRQNEAAAMTGLRATLPSPSAAANEFKVESEKLSRLHEALWLAFEARPEAGLPNTLIDLTMAYTGALRLQLSLKAIASRQLAPSKERLPHRDIPPKS